MTRYLFFRILAAVPVLLGITLIVFVILSMIPGDPAMAILGSYATPENVARLNQQLGLDRPLLQRYFIWLGNLLQGDFGRSFALNRPVIDEILDRFHAANSFRDSFYHLFACRDCRGRYFGNPSIWLGR